MKYTKNQEPNISYIFYELILLCARCAMCASDNDKILVVITNNIK